MWIQSQTGFSSLRLWHSSWWQLWMLWSKCSAYLKSVKPAVCILFWLFLFSDYRLPRLISSWTQSVSTRLMVTQLRRCWKSHQFYTVPWRPNSWPWEKEWRRKTASLSLISVHGWDALMYTVMSLSHMEDCGVDYFPLCLL